MKQKSYERNFEEVVKKIKIYYSGCRDVIIVDYTELDNGEYEFEFYLIY